MEGSPFPGSQTRLSSAVPQHPRAPGGAHPAPQGVISPSTHVSHGVGADGRPHRVVLKKAMWNRVGS